MNAARLPLPALLGLASLLAGPVARADAPGAGASCELAATPLVFGTYRPAAMAPLDFIATLVVTCATSLAAPMAVNGSVAALAPADALGRLHGRGGATLRYQLFLDPARTIPFGDGRGTGLSAPVAGLAAPGAPFRQEIPVYGRLLARQVGIPAGGYLDQVTLTLTY